MSYLITDMSGNSSINMQVYNAANSTSLFQYSSPISAVASGDTFLRYSPNGTLIAFASAAQGTIQFFQTSNYSIVETVSVPGYAYTFAYSPSGNDIAAITNTGLSIISTASYSVIATVPLNSPLSSVAYSPDGSYIAATNSETGEVYIIQTSNYSLYDTIAITVAAAVSFAPNGGQIAVASTNANDINGFVSFITITNNITVTISPDTVCIPGTSQLLTATIPGDIIRPMYSWSFNGNTIPGAVSPTYNATIQGLYGVTVSGFTPSVISVCGGASAYVTFAPQVSISATPTNNVCPGTNVILTATVTGGTAPYSYQWYLNSISDPIAGAVNSTYEILDATTSATYLVVVTDANACMVQQSIALTVSGSNSPQILVEAPGQAVCPGTLVTFTATVSGGSGSYAYQWYLNSTAHPIAGATSASYSVTATTTNTYIIVATDTTTMCMNQVSALLRIDSPQVTISANPSNVICGGTQVTLTANVTGGGGGYTYQWYLNSTLDPIPGATNETYELMATASNTYIVVVQDIDSCTGQASILLTVNPIPQVSITATPPGRVCGGTEVVLASTVTSGTPAYTYQWYLNSLSSPIPGATAQIYVISSASITSTYILQVTDANACRGEASLLVTVDAPQVSISATPSDVVCAGTNVTLGANVTSGTPPYTYQWYLNSISSPISGATNSTYVIPADSSTNTYLVKITDGDSCTNQASVLVTVDAPQVTISATPPDEVCVGTDVTLTANVTSGIAPYSYQWYVNASPIAGATNASYEFVASASNTYTVVVTDSIACTAQESLPLTVNPLPNAMLSGTTTIDYGQSAQISATITGQLPFTITWSDVLQETVTSPTTRTVSPKTTTSY